MEIIIPRFSQPMRVQLTELKQDRSSTEQRGLRQLQTRRRRSRQQHTQIWDCGGGTTDKNEARSGAQANNAEGGCTRTPAQKRGSPMGL